MAENRAERLIAMMKKAEENGSYQVPKSEIEKIYGPTTENFIKLLQENHKFRKAVEKKTGFDIEVKDDYLLVAGDGNG